MKILSDNKEVLDRQFYYLLDWNDSNRGKFIFETFSKTRIRDLTFTEFTRLLDYALKEDMNSIMDNNE